MAFGSPPENHAAVARARLAAAAKSARAAIKAGRAGDCVRVVENLRYAQGNLSYAEANLNSYAAPRSLIAHDLRLSGMIERLWRSIGWQCTARPGGGHGINRRK